MDFKPGVYNLERLIGILLKSLPFVSIIIMLVPSAESTILFSLFTIVGRSLM